MEAFLFMVVGPLAVSLAFVLYMSQTERWLQELFFEGIDLVGFLVMYSAFNGRSVQELPRLSSLVDRSCAPTAQHATCTRASCDASYHRRDADIRSSVALMPPHRGKTMRQIAEAMAAAERAAAAPPS